MICPLLNARCIVHTSRNMKLIKPFDERMISNERKYKNNNQKKMHFYEGERFNDHRSSFEQQNERKKRMEWNDEEDDCLIVTKHLYFH